MNKKVWITPNINGGWRQHKPGDKRDIIHPKNRDEAIAKAREIAEKYEYELSLQPKHLQSAPRNSYGRDPFPPRNH